MPASASSLQCGNCGSAMFTESTELDDVREREGRASYWSVLTWAVGYFILSTAVGLVFALTAQFVGGMGLIAAAQGLALAPVVFSPLITLLFFAYFTGGRTAPIAHSVVLFSLITLGSLGLHLVISGSLQAFFPQALSTLLFATLGTAVGLFFHRSSKSA
jgi:hypothetical protein